MGFVLPEHPALGGAAAEAVLLAAAELGYRDDRFREKKRAALSTALVVPPPGERPAYRQALPAIAALAESTAFARDLANTPPNQATPEWMAARARDLGRATRMKVAVLGPRELARRGMGGILAVGGGSANGPRLVRLEVGRGPITVALIGKGVTFDTGGISIKPAAGMEDMKYDKSGACTVLGIARAAAALRLPVRLRVYAPFAENMASGSAYRPGDVVRCYNGKTVDITNTDAEGRMLLADALAWAAEEKPDVMLDYATLTGACVVALGTSAAGLFSPDDRLAARLLEAAAASGERLWRLPLWPEYLDDMKGIHADLKNSGGRWGGASSAAAFLSQFTGGFRRWAHLDIAGAAYVGSERGSGDRGATGYGIATTVRLLRGLAAEAGPNKARRPRRD
jgi:leucyl aminopeptidase